MHWLPSTSSQRSAACHRLQRLSWRMVGQGKPSLLLPRLCPRCGEIGACGLLCDALRAERVGRCVTHVKRVWCCLLTSQARPGAGAAGIYSRGCGNVHGRGSWCCRRAC